MHVSRPRRAARALRVAFACALMVGVAVALSTTAEAVHLSIAGDAGSTAGARPIGTGWTEIFPRYKLDHPPGLVRHTLINGVHHMWILNTDPSTFPGHDSGPRSELRFYNDYTSGAAQFQADIEIASGCFNASIMQVFGASGGHSTAFMAWATQPNRLSYYSGPTIFSPVYDQYLTLNVIHDTASAMITVYVNGVQRGTFHDHGGSKHYFKTGVYHQVGMSARCDVFEKNIHIYKK